MQCQDLQNNSTQWILCDNPAISDTLFCESLRENLFDIEVLDDQNNQIAQFEGSAQGMTLDNLESSTYRVNEIEAANGNNQLVEKDAVEDFCINQGFSNGGVFFIFPGQTSYQICFEYEDEQGNDCSTIILAAGEEKTCTVKNYISLAVVIM